ncbi:protein kinase [Streptomyces sp. SID10853]|nr:protein kinase [Streptomyces sp. SID10853]
MTLGALHPDDPQEVAGYRLRARLGEGGMGTVFLSHTRGSQPVAFKLIRRELSQDDGFRRRFEQEVRAARRVQGYHLVPVVDHYTTGDMPWVASEFVPGIPLEEALDDHGALPLPTVFQLVGCTALALTAIHAAGVVHRDLKPSNLMLAATGPYVIDFGIARAADATKLTTSGKFIGTPQYMSPEHALGDPVGPASDLFSLGLIAAVAATGRHPYGEGGGLTIATQIANTAARPPDLSEYPGILRPLLERCLAADPADRIPAAELAALCEEYGGRPLRDIAGWLPGPLSARVAVRAEAARAAGQEAPRQGGEAGGAPTEQSTSGGTSAGSGPSGTAGPYGPPPGTAGSHRFADTATHPWTEGPQQPGFGGPYGGDPGTRQPSPPPFTPAQQQWSAGGGSRKRRNPVLITCLSVGGAFLALLIALIAWLWPDGGSPDPGPGPGPTVQSPTHNEKNNGGEPEKLIAAQPFALRAPAEPEVVPVDLDKPRIYGHDETADGDEELVMSEVRSPESGGRWELETPMGISSGTSYAKCNQAPGSNALSGNVESTELKRQRTIKAGTVLCTRTSEGNLAMLVIERITPSSGSDLPDVQTKLTLWGAE